MIQDEIKSKEFEIAQMKVELEESDGDRLRLLELDNKAEDILNQERSKGFAMDVEIEKFDRKGKQPSGQKNAR